jgi:uncharacterized protein (DUF1499 family)
MSVFAKLWTLVGPADLGDVAFETLKRRRTPNDALAAPAGFSPAKVDIVPPVYAVDAAALRAAFARAIADEERLEKVAADDSRLTDRYVQRSAALGFPDTIVVRFLDAGPGRSTLALYGRSQLGRRDLGVNRARIARWIGKLNRQVPPKS